MWVGSEGAPKNWCFWTVVFEKTLESSLDKKEIKLVNPKGNQSWIFTGRTDVEAEALVLWPSDVKSGLIRKDPETLTAGERDGRGWDGRMASSTQWTWVWENFGKDKRSLVCSHSWGHKELDMTEQLNNSPMYLFCGNKSKNKYTGLHQTKKFHSKGNHQQNEKATYQMGKNLQIIYLIRG